MTNKIKIITPEKEIFQVELPFYFCETPSYQKNFFVFIQDFIGLSKEEIVINGKNYRGLFIHPLFKEKFSEIKEETKEVIIKESRRILFHYINEQLLEGKEVIEDLKYFFKKEKGKKNINPDPYISFIRETDEKFVDDVIATIPEGIIKLIDFTKKIKNPKEKPVKYYPYCSKNEKEMDCLRIILNKNYRIEIL